jgi:hypothetical protein
VKRQRVSVVLFAAFAGLEDAPAARRIVVVGFTVAENRLARCPGNHYVEMVNLAVEDAHPAVGLMARAMLSRDVLNLPAQQCADDRVTRLVMCQ